MIDRQARASGALYGLAMGDALGMPTQSLPRAVIAARYGEVVDGFHAAPADHPLAAGLPAGSVTDDTEQAVLLARVIIDGNGTIDPAELGRRLLSWEDDMRARGSLDLLGPSTKAAVVKLLAGMSVADTGSKGATNGAAMRITPVGIATGCQDLTSLVDQVAAASSFSHHTSLALAGAAAVAAAVSAGVSGHGVTGAIEVALEAAELGGQRGHWIAGGHIGPRIRWAVDLVANCSQAQLFDRIDRLVGTSLASQESVPAAFAVFARYGDDPFLACRIAASVGGDCDTIAAMCGAMCGACHGVGAFPAAMIEQLTRVNRLDLSGTATQLLALRAP